MECRTSGARSPRGSVTRPLRAELTYAAPPGLGQSALVHAPARQKL